MIEYRLSPEDDELDDFDEGAELSLDDDMGDYGLDDDDEELAVPGFVPRPPAPAVVMVETAVIEVEEVPPAAVAVEAPPARKPGSRRQLPARGPHRSTFPAARRRGRRNVGPWRSAGTRPAESS